MFITQIITSYIQVTFYRTQFLLVEFQVISFQFLVHFLMKYAGEKSELTTIHNPLLTNIFQFYWKSKQSGYRISSCIPAIKIITFGTSWTHGNFVFNSARYKFRVWQRI